MVTQGMGYEVDYLPVGEGEKSGDAIAMRWGDLEGGRAPQRVIVIDGGTKESGLALVERIDSCYQTDKVDLVICTHCDADHASGLSVVIRELQVGALLMHTPWQYAENIHKIVTDGRVTEQSLRGHDLRPVWCVKVLKDFWPVGADDGFVAFPLT